MARTRCATTCSRCHKSVLVCLCADARPIETTVRLVMLRHRSEIWRPSSTAGIVELALPSVRVFDKDDADAERELAGLIASPDTRPYLVFPDTGGPAIDELARSGVWNDGPPPLFVMLDGSWRQARRMRSRKPFLRGLPTVTLRPDRPSEYRIRRQSKQGHLSTVEAVALLLGTVEGTPTRYDPLLDLLDLMVDRIFALRGLDRDGQVLSRRRYS